MNMLSDVYICPLRKTSAPILPENGQKNVHTWHYRKFTADAKAIVKVNILMEKVGQGIQEWTKKNTLTQAIL